MIKKWIWLTILDIDILMKKKIQWSVSILLVNEKQIVDIIATFFFFISLFIYLIIYRSNFNFNFEKDDE